ncbi:YqhR family membrane protein [Lederbergia lenta]|uniref:Integral inner membrane protein n=1 Tax=Lederbergia lenta TaxID=1467 RepID=A0A2X4W0K7_LEDLE|nr:YqhR family membrane protein [Lederbergia lenta]MEC2325152.1 YqhR family membrane protein [Lederbergia lenta]SQI56209.1 integral inner membrane protein [Lederbergia lenta]
MENEKAIGSYQVPLMMLTVITGFIAGILGSAFCYLAHYFHFTSISPAIILAPINGVWKQEWLGVTITIILYGLISIAVALFYYLLLRKKTSLYWGLAYGIAIYLVLFIGLPALIAGMKPIYKYDFITMLTELCFFIIYGTFIGFSISYEYNEQQQLKKTNINQ